MIDFEEAYIRVCNKHDAVRDENDKLRARIAELTALTQECCDHIGDRYPDDQVMRRRIKKIVGESS